MSNARKPDALNQRHKIFVRGLFEGKSITAAAKEAGCPDRSAHVTGSRWLRMAKIRTALDAMNKAANEASGITEERTRRQVARIAFADPGDLFTQDATLKPLHEMTADARAQIASIEVDEIFEGSGQERRAVGVTRKVRLRDMGKALDQCIEILGMARTADQAASHSLSITIRPHNDTGKPGSRKSGP